jgi:pyruvate dehydrogenase E2 component (dihydrolipoamide acetyltransferase)
MATYIEMPKLSDTMTEGTLVKWLVAEGDTISPGDSIAEIETDKATMEMEAFDGGILGKVYIKEGDKVPLGTALGVLVEEGEDVPEAPEASATAAPASDAGEDADDSPAEDVAAADTTGSDQPAAAAAAAPVTSSGRVKASPLAKKVAEQKGIDISQVAGTGPGGRIVRADVDNFQAPAAAAAVSAPAAQAVGSTPAAAGDQRIELSGMRKVIAERLLTSKTTIPHFYLNIELDAAPLMAFRKQINQANEATGGHKYTVNDFIMKAAVSAAVAEPRVNASFAGDAIIQYGDVHLSVAVAIDDGLVTPVIRQAQHKNLQQLSNEIKDLATRARSKKLSPDEMQGGTITISNLGAYGIDSFAAIINPPQAMILSIGGIVNQPVVNDSGEVVPGQRMWIGLSGDHRVVDGAVGALYLAEFRKLLENPALMLL